MTIRHNFIEFANLVGSIVFQSDEDYADCNGIVTLRNGPTSDDIIVYEPFFNAAERDEFMSNALAKAAMIMRRSSQLQKGF